MQAVILAAGESTRTYPLTLEKPKPLLKIAGKSIIEHNLEQLKGLVDEVILVVKGDDIKNALGDKFKGLKLTYVEQKEQLGTGHAVLQAKDVLKNRFVVLVGDDLFHKDDIKKCLNHRYAVLTKKVKEPEIFGVFVVKDKRVQSIVEKPKEFVSDLANTGLYVFDKKIFDFTLEKSERGEYEITDYINFLVKHAIVFCETVERYWIPIGYPWDLLEANRTIGKGNSIGKNCKIEGDVKDSVIMDNTTIVEGSIVESSVIGENVYFKGIAKAGKADIDVKGKIVKVEKIGAVIANNVRAEDVEIKPGVRIWPGKEIKGVIDKDVK